MNKAHTYVTLLYIQCGEKFLHPSACLLVCLGLVAGLVSRNRGISYFACASVSDVRIPLDKVDNTACESAELLSASHITM